ncbi:Asp23/Gls24 family envelope stress response protein [Williamsia sp. CHRR-6]|uniref:Asp23/Gls24 family envelope stress response protein n=1 Tax=Williamsia sp. CHRR-6 TaxID=2835871 RepID=UPI001BDAA6D9|nr:Asp23/Gls24 family envelope stress response protein [Williamsia sp. CHRR-6]MBT0567302.1 Asp23/Gls24 family envelope stress response protein [Williamsia sp. CHRR-6]
MADHAVVPPAPLDGGGPGETTIRDKVGEKIAAYTATQIEGVLRQRGSLGMITGGNYPKVSLDMSESHPSVSVEIAVGWPTPLTALAQEVRALVHSELGRLTGQIPNRVNVTVAEVVSGSDGKGTRRVL